MTDILALLRLVPTRDWLFAGLFTAAALGIVYLIGHERNIGYDECKAEQEKVNSEAQIAIDLSAFKDNHQLDKQFNLLDDALNSYEGIYAKPNNDPCPPVDIKRVRDANAAHKSRSPL